MGEFESIKRELNDLAHKLKTPLAMAMMSCDTLEDALATDDAELRDRSMKLMRKSVAELQVDVDEILNYIRAVIEKGRGSR